MSTPATPITFSLHNNGTHDIAIRSISYNDDSHIQHVADYTGIGGSPGDTRPDTIIRYIKTYLYGEYLEKNFVSDTHDRLPTYTTMTGVTLTVSTTEGIQPGWIVTGNGLTGRTVVTVTAPSTITLDGTYSGYPVKNATITFSTSTKAIVVDNADYLGTGWTIVGNGYELADNASITSINGTTLEVSKLPTSPTVGNPMIFSSSTNYLTLNNNTNLETGFTAKNNGYNDSQSIIAVLGDGQTVQMSAPPGSVPNSGNPITFTSNANLVVIAAGTTATFVINYTSTGPAAVNYHSLVTINAIQLPSTPLTGYIDNYVNVNYTAPSGGTVAFTTVYSGGGGGGRGGQGYTTTVTTFSDGSTMSITTSNTDGSVTSISSTAAPDPGASLGDGLGVSSVSSFGSNADASSGGGGGGGGGSRVICTHFYRKGMMSRQVWRADMEYTFNYLSPATVRGYQYWAIPYVRLMRRSPLAEKIMYPLMMARAEELAYKMGVLEKGNWAGKLVRLVFEPICFTIGLFVGEQNWKSLWDIKINRNT